MHSDNSERKNQIQERVLTPIDSFRSTPLRVQFIVTSLPVGGAEILLRDLVSNFDRTRIEPEVVCLKEAGALGDEFASHVPVHSNFLKNKWDLRVFSRLTRHFRASSADAVVTVGAGDKMFWGRLAAARAKVPVICSAVHSTGWPDGIGLLNKLLTPMTAGFIACAENHAHYLIRGEGLPEDRVFAISNGVDTQRFLPDHHQREQLRRELHIAPDSKIVGIVAALREEKNHLQLIHAAREIVTEFPNVHFAIVGDGPERSAIKQEILDLDLTENIHILGNRSDTERILPGLDVFCLTSRNEASPVSILEALSCGIPVVAPDVGSINESVLHRQTGLLTEPECASSTSSAIRKLINNPPVASSMGMAGRQLVREKFSLHSMVGGYQHLIAKLYNRRARVLGIDQWKPAAGHALQDPQPREAQIILPGLAPTASVGAAAQLQ